MRKRLSPIRFVFYNGGFVEWTDGNLDQPWAWQSREFLRQKLIGKQVTYVIESKTPKKEYGIVFLQEENIAKDIVANGWARVRRPPSGAKDINP